MGRATQRRERAGLSLVELLVVLGMIGVISAVVVPISIRNGWFTGSKSAFAARELFTILKAARVYASTYNVETAVAYGGALVKDSELPGHPCVPVADSIIFARRLKREELIVYGLAANSTNIFVPLSSADGAFRTLPKQMAVLPDLFEVDPAGVSKTGLKGIQIYDVNAPGYLDPRVDACSGLGVLDYTLDSLLPSSFPAHRFLPDGSLRAPEGVQRFRFRVGARPDAAYKDRFFTKPDADVISSRPISVVFNAGDASTPASVDMNVVDNGNANATDDYVDIATSIELFAPTGRVKLLP
jgi:hypothetical protein